MSRPHSTGRLLTLTGLAFLCGLGSATRLPVTDGVDRPSYRLITGGVALPATGASTVQEGPGDTARRDRGVDELRSFSAAFADVAEAVIPAVVRITTERSLGEAHAGVRDRLRDMFDLPEDHPDAMPGPQRGGGTGFLVAADGLILTNNHVVAEADHIMVTLWDKRVFPARVIGADPTTDLALVKVDGRNLPHARLGDSDEVRVGEWLLAIGNPGFAYETSTLDFTVTSGILSAKGRPLGIIGQELSNATAPYAIEDFLQTDAAINPGNSGGPLVDLHGRIIGINTAIASGTGFNQGYGFAIPINVAKSVMDDLIEHGRVRRPLLGISIQNITAEDAEVYRLPRIAGVLVEDFQNGSPAERAGMRRHDVIVGVEGREVERLGQFQRLVAQHDPGDVVEVEAIRFGERLRFDVRLTEADLGEPVTRTPGRVRDRSLGLEVVDLTPAVARERGFRRSGGALIAMVEPDGIARLRNVPPNTIIRSVNRERVGSAEEALAMIRQVPSGEVVSLLLESRTGATYIRNLRIP